MAEAKAWRVEALAAVNAGTLRAPKPTTVEQAAAAWLAGARAGLVRNRSGDTYKPSAIRSYEKNLRLRVLPRFGLLKLGEVRVLDVQDYVDRMLADGLAPATIDCAVNPLRAIYRQAVQRGEVSVNPTRGISLPANRRRRERFASPEEAEKLLAALPSDARPLWATAIYAGLRRGELRALLWESVDLAAGLIRVERSWDDEEGEIDAKTDAGNRKTPIPAVLRDYLDQLERREGFVFGVDGEPFNPRVVSRIADNAWRDAGLKRITLHGCRHTYASFMIASGVNAHALMTFMGHANIQITHDKYGHLMPGSENEAAALLDSFLERQGAEQARAAGGKAFAVPGA